MIDKFYRQKYVEPIALVHANGMVDVGVVFNGGTLVNY
jgi:hypothetical protein